MKAFCHLLERTEKGQVESKCCRQKCKYCKLNVNCEQKTVNNSCYEQFCFVQCCDIWYLFSLSPITHISTSIRPVALQNYLALVPDISFSSSSSLSSSKSLYLLSQKTHGFSCEKKSSASLRSRWNNAHYLSSVSGIFRSRFLLQTVKHNITARKGRVKETKSCEGRRKGSQVKRERWFTLKSTWAIFQTSLQQF